MGQAASASEKVHLLRFGGGDGHLLRSALLEGPAFRPCRDSLGAAGHSCVHPSEAIVLVRPEQFSDVSTSLADHELHPFHIVITESFEYLLEEVLLGIPCRRRPREKLHARKQLEQPVGETAEGQDAKAEFLHIFDVQRTFLCLAPQYKDPRTVVQSTTEAVRSAEDAGEELRPREYHQHKRGINPRRVV